MTVLVIAIYCILFLLNVTLLLKMLISIYQFLYLFSLLIFTFRIDLKNPFDIPY